MHGAGVGTQVCQIIMPTFSRLPFRERRLLPWTPLLNGAGTGSDPLWPQHLGAGRLGPCHMKCARQAALERNAGTCLSAFAIPEAFEGVNPGTGGRTAGGVPLSRSRSWCNLRQVSAPFWASVHLLYDQEPCDSRWGPPSVGIGSPAGRAESQAPGSKSVLFQGPG